MKVLKDEFTNLAAIEVDVEVLAGIMEPQPVDFLLYAF